jgi:hypothetical protein
MVSDVRSFGRTRQGLTDPASFVPAQRWSAGADSIGTSQDLWAYPPKNWHVERRVVLSIEGGPIPWVRSVEQRLNHLLALPRGWDGHGAPPPHMDALVATIGLLIATMSAETPVPAIFPTYEGGLQLAWHQGGIDLEIEIPPRSRYEVSFYDDTDPDNELDLFASEDAIRDVLAEITRREFVVA